MSNMYDMTSGERGKTLNPLHGECPHKCSYCYVNALKERWKIMEQYYSGKPRLYEPLLEKRIPQKGVVFICSCNDLFAEAVPAAMIRIVLDWTIENEEKNTYLFQSKNPERMRHFNFPKDVILGATIETDRLPEGITEAPGITSRLKGIRELKQMGYTTMITIEPVMEFSTPDMLDMLRSANADIIHIGADSQDSELPEPKKEDLETLIEEIRGWSTYGFRPRVILKSNLDRILE